MKIEANGLGLGAALTCETILTQTIVTETSITQTTGGDGLNPRLND
jgi:hypothetical protein